MVLAPFPRALNGQHLFQQAYLPRGSGCTLEPLTDVCVSPSLWQAYVAWHPREQVAPAGQHTLPSKHHVLKSRLLTSGCWPSELPIS